MGFGEKKHQSALFYMQWRGPYIQTVICDRKGARGNTYYCIYIQCIQGSKVHTGLIFIRGILSVQFLNGIS